MGKGGTQDYTQKERQRRFVQRHYTQNRLRILVKQMFDRLERNTSLVHLLSRTDESLTNLFIDIESTTLFDEDNASKE